MNGNLLLYSADMDRYGSQLHQEFVLDYISRHKDESFFLYYPASLAHSTFHPAFGTCSLETVRQSAEMAAEGFRAHAERT